MSPSRSSSRKCKTLLKSRSLDDWKTYLRWHLVHAQAPYLSSPFVQANFDFYSKYLRGVQEMPPRWKRCVRRVDRDLGEALGQVFVAEDVRADTKSARSTMTKEIEAAMESEIKQLAWMGDATKQRALEKLHAIVNKIGYPDKWRDYSSIKIARDDFFGNVERATLFESRRELAKIGKPVDRTEWEMTPPTVNAYYDPQMNDINFPAGVLQPPLFDPKMDDAPNYGNTGATIGHELTHGFDDEGRQFDAKGNLKDWWTKEDADGVREARRLRLRSVFAVHRDRRHQDQRQADAGRRCRRPGRHVAGLHGLEGRHQGSEPAADRRLHARSALLHRHGAVGLRRRAPGEQAR